MIGDDTVFDRVSEAVRQTFNVPPTVTVVRETSSVDIDGWDSLSYSMLIMNVEAAFNVDLPIAQLYDLANVGELAELVRATLIEQETDKNA